MHTDELHRTGRLDEATGALDIAIRGCPTGVRRRTLLFERLCRAGDYERAARQLDELTREVRELVSAPAPATPR